MKKITLLLLSAVVAFSQSLPLPKATEAQARAGTDNNTVMTPLRTKQAIEENGGSGTVTSVNGNTGAVTVQAQSANLDAVSSGVLPALTIGTLTLTNPLPKNKIDTTGASEGQVLKVVSGALTYANESGGTGRAIGDYFRVKTGSTLATNVLLANGANGTANVADADGLTTVVQGGGTLAGPTPNVTAGEYAVAQNVTFTPSVVGATVKYTTDGSTAPSRSVGSTASGAVAIAATTTVKTMEYKDHYVDSAVTTATWTITPATSYLLSDDLLYADNSAFTTAGWGAPNGGSPVAHYTTATNSGFASALKMTWGDYSTRTFTAQTTGDSWSFFTVTPTAITSSPIFFSLYNGTTRLAYLVFTSSGTIKVLEGAGGGTEATAAFTVGTQYYIWLRYVPGTGSNSTAEVYLSTTPTIPGSYTFRITTGVSTLYPNRVQLGSSANGTVIFNYLRIDDAAIGSSPL